MPAATGDGAAPFVGPDPWCTARGLRVTQNAARSHFWDRAALISAHAGDCRAASREATPRGRSIWVSAYHGMSRGYALVPKPFGLTDPAAEQEGVARLTVGRPQLAAVITHRNRQEGVTAAAVEVGHGGILAQTMSRR